jgi:uncharacterized protein
MIARLLILAAFLFAVPALAQTYPPLSGRVVDQANILEPEQEAALTQKLEALQNATTRQLVVATVASLEDRSIEEYGVGLGRAWGIGQSQANNGVILIVAPNERKMRIEVGYGMEGILTDALASQIIRNEITPRFRENDYPGGINAGVDAIVAQLQAPPEAAEARVRAAADAHRSRRGGGGSILTLIFWIVILVVIIIASIVRRGVRGRRFGGRRGRRSPVIIWGPGLGGGGWGGGSWGSGGGGSSWGGGGGGGFSGGGGSFGGGGASGGW